MTTFEAIDFKDRRRAPKWERDLFDWLLQESETRRKEFLLELLNYQFIVALQLSNKVLESRDTRVELLEYGVATSDASSIKYWLESLVPRLGFRRSVNVLLRLASSYPEGVNKALYWMPQFASSERDREKLQDLLSTINSDKDCFDG